ncbi:PqiA/YebS family transporter subunit [Pseudoalteromonas piscicida]|uniref:PqiA/YebS family transporter subunit n=1 Tax=Pseudoalteromonas piscicida TaxID=43662 RepID=UPI000E35A430|nr:PqiA/YebS family transporter subunit [Pseudoalteromonas piscicida]AXQ99770.1 PqiA/YebS family transporter subunit [Pseudoalteromonas piscicida]
MITACPECDTLVEIDSIESQKRAVCPNCRCVLCHVQGHQNQLVQAFSFSALLFLFASLFPDFISYTQHGITQVVSLWQALILLAEHYSYFLAGLFAFTILIMPVAVCSLLLLAHTEYWQIINAHNARHLAKLLSALKPLNLTDIFLVAVLVSAFKLMSFAELEMGLGFWAYILFVLCFIEALSLFDHEYMWRNQTQFNRHLVEPKNLSTMLKRCKVCGYLGEGEKCQRCYAKLKYRKSQSTQKSLAWMLTSVVLLVPANFLPIMDTISLGLHTPATIFSGVQVLWEGGSYPVATLIFLASICIPIAKALLLSYLLIRVKKPKDPITATKVYRLLEFIGRWSMIDVFVVIILVSLVQLGTVLNVEPEIGIVFFTLMVLCQIAAVNSFDPRLLWDKNNQ